jgi:hypothetical protein
MPPKAHLVSCLSVSSMFSATRHQGLPPATWNSASPYTRYSILDTLVYHLCTSSSGPPSLWASNFVPLPPCHHAHLPLEGFAFAYFPTAGAGISFILVAPMATILSIMP